MPQNKACLKTSHRAVTETTLRLNGLDASSCGQPHIVRNLDGDRQVNTAYNSTCIGPTCQFCGPGCSTCVQPCLDMCTHCGVGEIRTTNPVVSQIPNGSRSCESATSEITCQHCKLDCNICQKPCASICSECNATASKCIFTKDSNAETFRISSQEQESETGIAKLTCLRCEPDCKDCKTPCSPYLHCYRCCYCITGCTKCSKPCSVFYRCEECKKPCKTCEGEFSGQQKQSLSCTQRGICKFKGKIKMRFHQWTSGNQQIDKILQESQLMTRDFWTYLEWIDPDLFTNIKHIASGGFGSVYFAECSKSSGFEYQSIPHEIALKTLNIQGNTSGNVYNEVINSLKISDIHTPIVFGISRLVQSNEYVIVMEYFRHGNLRSALDKCRKKYFWSSRLKCIRSIVKALVEVHKKDIIHCDLHTGNILICDHIHHQRISDFGLSKALNDEAATSGGSYGIMPYMAPELFNGKPNSKATDIYALGMIMWEVTAVEPPFSDRKHGPQLMMEICSGLRPPIVNGTPECWVTLMQKCWDSDPSKRPSAEELENKLYEWKPRGGQFMEADKYRKKNPRLFRKKRHRHPQAIYTSRFIPHIKTLSVDALNDDDWNSILENMN